VKETPGKIILSWGLFFAVAWLVRVHVALAAGVAVVGCVACLTVWAVATLWRAGRRRDELAMRAAPQWYALPSGRVVDAEGNEP
jgi:hypothetical protein